MTSLHDALEILVAGRDLDAPAAYAAFAAIMDGRASDVEMAALLTALRVKGEAVGEIVGAARAMHERVTPIRAATRGLVDTCGTGGDELSTFNVSTAAALVLAACGVPVAKHGNRSVSSTSGSADVLEQLGICVSLAPEAVARCIDERKIGFCFAPLLHTAMKHAGPVRKQLRFRTMFNLLGPLTNPAGAEYQLIGTGRIAMASRLAHALVELGRKHAFVVCGADHLDEVCLWDQTTAFEVAGGHVIEHKWTARTFNLAECRVDDLRVYSPAESAEVLRHVFQGKPGPARDMVLANAAVGLMAAERTNDPRAGVALAAEAIDSGRVLDLVRDLAEFTQKLAPGTSGFSA